MLRALAHQSQLGSSSWAPETKLACAQVRDIAQPCLLLWGKQDKILDVKYVKEFQRDLQNVQTRIVDDCGHVPHLEQSTVCADEILKFAGLQQSDMPRASREAATV